MKRWNDCYKEKQKAHIKTLNSKYLPQHGMTNSIPDIQYSFEYIIKKHEKPVGNPPIKIYISKTEKVINT